MDTRIYVMTHKQIGTFSHPAYHPLHVGRLGKEDLGYPGDDTGEHISGKNSSYCELTGMYWVWKNVTCDIVGICHYRRYFTKDERLLDQDYIEHMIEQYPIIVPNSRCVDEPNVYEHYGQRHYKKDLDVCRQVIAEKYPEYLRAFDHAMYTKLVSIGNMWITRKDIYDSYCCWLFDILFEVEQRLDTTGYDDYQKRVMGFLSERLFRAWLFMQPVPIREENVKEIEPAEFENANRRVELTYQYVRLKLMPVLQLHQIGAGSLAESFACGDDFDGKVPVWINWWQGEDEMPELIRLCYESIKRNLPAEKTALRLITLDNCRQYVTFTEPLIHKFQEGKISYTQFSDVLRAELLYRYGGMWIDTTYYVTHPIPETYFQENGIYTIRFDSPVWDTDITRGRWSGNLWCVRPGHRLFQFLMEALWYYFETEDTLIDYYLIDYIIAVAVEEFSEIREELSQCETSRKTVFHLHAKMNQRYTPQRMNVIEKESLFYKLNRHAEYFKKNIAGEDTIYGELLRRSETHAS